LENDNLIKSKEQYLELINSIAKEKQMIPVLKKRWTEKTYPTKYSCKAIEKNQY
jgi:hypothetical protein